MEFIYRGDGLSMAIPFLKVASLWKKDIPGCRITSSWFTARQFFRGEIPLFFSKTYTGKVHKRIFEKNLDSFSTAS